MPEPVDTLIDHAAELQQQMDAISRELLLLAVAVMALGIAVTMLGVKLWRA